MKTIIFYLYDNDELKAWIDILDELDVDWDLQTVRSERKPDRKCYEITARVQSKCDYDELCHLAYRQYYKYTQLV